MNTFNLSLDDFCPHEKAGLNFEVINSCNKLIEEFPELKINLFVPLSYCRLGEQPHHLLKYPKWVERVNNLPETNYRINLHGIYHRRHPSDNLAHQKYPPSNNDEWQYLNASQAHEFLHKMIDGFTRAGLKYHSTFRPPGWKVSPCAVEVLLKNDFIIAGNKEYENKYKHLPIENKWISYNWDMVEECNIKTEDVIAYGHTSSWTNNYMNDTRLSLILKLLREREFSFKFIEDC